MSLLHVVLWGCALGLLVLQIILLLIAWRHLARRLREVQDAQQIAASTDVPTSMLVTGMAKVEARLQQLESARKAAAAATPAAPAPADDRAYQLAQRMARNGADAAQIAEACGIALHEAELLARLHAPAR